MPPCGIACCRTERTQDAADPIGVTARLCDIHDRSWVSQGGWDRHLVRVAQSRADGQEPAMSEHSEPPAGTAGPLAPGGLESATGAPLFSAPSFRKFTMLACGFV